MAQFSLHAYDADVWLPEFKGLQQNEEGLNGDLRFAAEEVNLETPQGVLQPHAGYTLMDGEFISRIETMARFHRRWYSGTGSKEWIVCAAGGKLYYKQADSANAWTQIEMPTGVTSFQSNVWSWVTYEINDTQVVDHPIDVLLISNAEDGMYMVIPPDRPTIFNDLVTKTFNELALLTFDELISPQWQIQMVDTRADRNNDEEPQKKFGVIERYNERVWGTGMTGEPDLLVYSAVYNPTDWRAYPYYDPDDESCDADDPSTWIGQAEDGAGDISQPSWDGDSFNALKAFGNQMIAFKGNRVWRVMGVSPGEFTLSEQYGGGTKYPNTIAVDVERMLFATDEGISLYDGMSITPFIREQIAKVWKTVNKAALDQMCGVLHKDKYYLSFPVDGSTVNNAVIVYDKTEQTVLYYRDMEIESLLSSGDVLYATSSSLPGRVLIMHTNSWESGQSSGAATKWVSPWIDFGYKRIVKGGFDFYFAPEVQDEAVTLRISIETEKKVKTKMYTVDRTVKEHRYKRLHFGGSGRKFRIIIETDEGNKAPWRLVGGLQLVVETDPD